MQLIKRMKERFSTKLLSRMSELLCLNCCDTKLPVTLWIGKLEEKNNSLGFYFYIVNNDKNRITFDSDLSEIRLYDLMNINETELELKNKTHLSSTIIRLVMTFLKRSYPILSNYYLKGERSKTLIAIRTKV